MRQGKKEACKAALTKLLGSKRIHNKEEICNDIEISINSQSQKSLKDQVSRINKTNLVNYTVEEKSIFFSSNIFNIYLFSLKLLQF